KKIDIADIEAARLSDAVAFISLTEGPLLSFLVIVGEHLNLRIDALHGTQLLPGDRIEGKKQIYSVSMSGSQILNLPSGAVSNGGLSVPQRMTARASVCR